MNRAALNAECPFWREARLLRAKNELPLRLLQKSIDLKILVKLKDGSEYIGRLEKSDISMNLILAEAMQVNERNEPLANYGKILIRGNNILYISVEPEKVGFYE